MGRSSLEHNMKKILLPLLLAALGLGGCVAVPVNGGGYAPAPSVYVAPPAVVVRPWYYGFYGGGRGYRYH
jgi:hypothetical protein